jgi:hypothetical protein
MHEDQSNTCSPVSSRINLKIQLEDDFLFSYVMEESDEKDDDGKVSTAAVWAVTGDTG